MVETEELPCKICGKHFKGERGVKIHIRSAHPDSGPEETQNKESDTASSSGSDSNADTPCPFCSKSYKGSTGVQRHCRSAHPDKTAEDVRKSIRGGKTSSPNPAKAKVTKIYDQRDGRKYCEKTGQIYNAKDENKTDERGFKTRIRSGHPDSNQKVKEETDTASSSDSNSSDRKMSTDSVLCPVCKRPCNSEKGVKIHAGRMHKDITKERLQKLLDNAHLPNTEQSDITEIKYEEVIEEPVYDKACKREMSANACGVPPLTKTSNETDDVNIKKKVKKFIIEITMPKDEISHVSSIVNDFFGRFMEKLKREDNGWDVLKSGSYFDGTKNNQPDEFDFMIFPVTNVEAVFCHSYPPGYCKVRLLGPNKHIPKDIVDANNFINPTKFKKYAFGIFERCSSSRQVKRLERDTESPAYTIMYHHGIPNKQPIDIDLVPTIELNGWPSSVAKTISPSWLKYDSSGIAEKCMQKHHVVAKTCPFEDAPERDMLWRLSFSWAEKQLIYHANIGERNGPRKKVFRLLKMLLEITKKNHPGKVKKFASYHLKMYMLHQYNAWPYEVTSDVEEILIKVAKQLLTVLSHDPVKGYPCIKNYFLQKDNVVKHVPKTELQLFSSTIREELGMSSML